MAQTNTFEIEPKILQGAPVDVDVSPNGGVAVVRGNNGNVPGPHNDKLSLWATGVPDAALARITPTGTGTVGNGNLRVSATGLPLFSDCIAIANDRVISIASNQSEDRTYVDILSIDQSTDPPNAVLLQPYTLGTGISDPTRAGLAHDVAITPDGALAVVSHRNWIHVFRLSDGSKVAELNIGASTAGPCVPGDARGSVAVTNSRAVVTVQRLFNPSRTWVYILDLSQTNDPANMIKLAYDVGGLSGQQGSPSTDTGPHDLAITPNGQRAVVVTDHKVALFDLVNDSVLGTPYGLGLDNRDWNAPTSPDPLPNLWDSVELTNTRAVVLSNQLGTDQWLKFAQWRASVFDISGSTLLLKHTYGSSYPPPPPPPQPPLPHDPCWDVSISDDGQYASIKTLEEDVVLTNLTNAGAGDIRRAASPGFLSIAPDYTAPTRYWSGNDTTTILQPVGNPAKLWAVFVGAPTGNGQVKMNFYDLNSSTWTAGTSVREFFINQNPPGTGLLPADLDRGLNNVEVFLRLSAPALDPNVSGRPDWNRYSGVTLSQAGASWGGSGYCEVNNGSVLMADVLCLARGTSVSISQDLTTPFVYDGWVHIVSVQ